MNVSVEVPEHLLVFVDKPTIETVFRNLLSNAIKFTPKGKHIDINANKVEKMILLEVKDEGVGISEDNLNNLFSLEGDSTYGTDQEKGTGLGLLLCKEFVERNGGEISVQSKVNLGSTFTIKLPVSEA